LAPKKPLQGKVIAVTRPRTQARDFIRSLRRAGARVLACPTIRVAPPRSSRALDRAIRDLDSYDWLIFTSANGSDVFARRMKALRPRKAFPKTLRTCAIGPATAESMRAWNIPVTRISKEYVAESVLEAIPEPRGKKILIPRAAQAREVLPRELERRGARVRVVPAYRTVLDRTGSARLRGDLGKGLVDVVTFTSSSTVKNFFRLLGPKARRDILKTGRPLAASIGPITTGTLATYGWKPSVIAAKPTTRHLAEAIVRSCRVS